ncbi:hypothetical protein A3F06_03745 [candidate division TM6 bacterium RIFCSPHIGHO2_12_FULL_36_22]|nr:MAG: hypothetical protein A3F06_03745 [candidate division TM6 bacterium RIFCSPHIGHO2_12_FULL_36_22]
MKRMSILLLGSLISVAGITAKVEDKVLISVDGKAYLTEAGFEDFLDQVKASEPQLVVYMQMDPDGIREQLLQAKKQEAIMNAWADKNKITEKESYKNRKAIGEQALHSMLVHQEFVEQHKSEPTDADARKYYEEQKIKDPNLGTPGGIIAKGVKFATEKEAKDFQARLKTEEHDIDALADKDKNLDIQDFGIISESGFSFVDPKIKENIISKKKFPSSDVVKVAENEYWVAVALDEQKPEFEPFDQVKDVIKQQLAGKKVEEMFEREIPKYEKEFKVKTYAENLKKQTMQPATHAGPAQEGKAAVAPSATRSQAV